MKKVCKILTHLDLKILSKKQFFNKNSNSSNNNSINNYNHNNSSNNNHLYKTLCKHFKTKIV